MPKSVKPSDLQLSHEVFEKRSFASNSPRPIELRRAPLIDVKSKSYESKTDFGYIDVLGKLIDHDIHFLCITSVFNRLIYNGAPLSAKSLSYYFSGIQWRAGDGWPVYSSRCPRADLVADMLFPSAPAHALIVQFGGYFWPECANSNVGVGNQITDVFVGANDDKFDDNTGTFTFIVSSYGQ